jgi:hypothetical protein
MRKLDRTKLWIGLLGTAVMASALPTTGCGKDRDTPQTRVLKGRVTRIDPSGEVEGEFYFEGMKDYRRISGRLSPTAEILINGETARLEDVKIDDVVQVTGYEEKRGGSERGPLIATRVEVTRPTAGTTQPADAPPTAPAESEEP